MKHPSPTAITNRSFEIIEGRLGSLEVSDSVRSIIIRVAHTTGDVEFAKTFQFTDGVVNRAVAALRSGCTVVTDVEMVRTGIRAPGIEAFGGSVQCFLNELEVISQAKDQNTTRSARAMRFAGSRLDGAIVAIGNAPTALFELIEMVEEGAVSPAAVIGVPVGFVGAYESKERLARTGIPHITVVSERGGSTIAAAIVNGIAVLAAQAGPPPYAATLGTVGGKRRGITTGTCAAAAAKAATMALLSAKPQSSVSITLPKSNRSYSGALIHIPVAWTTLDSNLVTSAVVKDAGDDDDVTDGAEICASVQTRETPGVVIEGGVGVGKVTREGLPVPPGRPAINPIPLRMIRAAVAEAAAEVAGRAGDTSPDGEGSPYGGPPQGTPNRGFVVTISVPNGEAIAAKTWNPRLGIDGGISIIGTAGVVEPKDSDAFVRSIEALVRGQAAVGRRRFIIALGYVGERYLFELIGVPEEAVITCGDHVGATIDACVKVQAEEILLVGHVSKLAKIAAGVFNTHSRYADARLETVAAAAAAVGAPSEAVRGILAAKTAEEAIGLVTAVGADPAFDFLAKRVVERMQSRAKNDVRCRCVLLALDASSLSAAPEPEGEILWNRFS